MEKGHAEQTFAQRLGWKGDDIVVLLHVDDVGMSHSSNRGAIESIEKGIATSFSVMMPCPWVPEIAKYLATHPQADCGLHLTLTSEWELYRWPPLAGKPAVPGLVDSQGCLWRSVAQVVQHASADEIETEIRAQIERAQNFEMPITHLDSHMGTLFARPDYFERYAKVGIEKQIPILAIGGHALYASRENPEAAAKLKPWIEKIWQAGLPVIDDLHTGSYEWKPGEKKARFLDLLNELQPGITEILFHASIPSDDFPLITSSSEARRADTQCLTDSEAKQIVARRGIILTTWKELMARRKKRP